ncbi:unannotated protein [freshwater metagenome]|uniref:Unannotated protein n=1 Tax=freshwater metagenome TaxID=449393 RepID=A0A6J6SCF8_9ZZZZ
MAATTGRGNFSRRRRLAFTSSHMAKTSAAFSLPAALMSLRSPPAKKVFFALATTTPLMLASSAARSS